MGTVWGSPSGLRPGLLPGAKLVLLHADHQKCEKTIVGEDPWPTDARSGKNKRSGSNENR